MDEFTVARRIANNYLDGQDQDRAHAEINREENASDNTLGRIQAEIGSWAEMNFGDNTSKETGAVLGSLMPLMGMVEEIGELIHPTLYRHQGRGFDDRAEYEAARDDAVGNLLIWLCDYTSREGIDLTKVLEDTWATVQNRRRKTWAEDKLKERSTSYVPDQHRDLARAANVLEQNSLGFGEPPEPYERPHPIDLALPTFQDGLHCCTYSSCDRAATVCQNKIYLCDTHKG